MQPSDPDPRPSLRSSTKSAALRGPLGVALLASSLLAAVGPALAQEAPDDEGARAIATDLFDRGVKIMVANKCDEAQPLPAAARAPCGEALDLFVKAARIYPKALGAIRNAAFVARGLGQVALASRNFREVARRAPLEQSESRRRWAAPSAEEAEALAPRIPYLVIKVTGTVPESLEVKLDGESIDPSLLGTRIALDPGEHTVQALAPSFLPAEVHVTLAERETKEAPLTLRPLPAPAASASASASHFPAPPPAPPPPPPPPEPSRAGPIALAATGGALVLTSAIFGLRARSARDSGCDLTARTCASAGDLDTARQRATMSTVFGIGGAALLAGGVIWWVVTPSPADASPTRVGLSPWLAPGAGGLAASGVLP
jgi:hypothetical protein